MNLTKFGSKVKGFTLLEMIIVMAIIGILAGISSMLIQGFQRNARLETDNNKAQMVHTGFQNILINCEIDQDRELFDPDAHDTTPAYTADPMIYTEVYFKMKEGKIHDVINVASVYDDGSAAGKFVSLPVMRNNAQTKKWFAELEKAILANIDSTFEGGMAVYIDYENYAVDSVIFVEGNYFDSVDLTDYTSGIATFFAQLDTYADVTDNGDSKKSFRILNTRDKQQEFVKYKGIYFGAYPTVMDY